ncbi:MAG: tetratricopeptide repeat protein [bacterium]
MTGIKMDWLDRLTIVLIMALSILTVGMVFEKSRHDRISGRAGENSRARLERKATRIDQKIYGEVEALIKVGRYEDALERLEGIMGEYPQKRGESQACIAQIYIGQGNLEKGIPLFRESIESLPAILELAPINEWIGDLVKKGLPKVERERKLRPGDQKLEELKKDLYYLQAKLLRGCG